MAQHRLFLQISFLHLLSVSFLSFFASSDGLPTPAQASADKQALLALREGLDRDGSFDEFFQKIKWVSTVAGSVGESSFPCSGEWKYIKCDSGRVSEISIDHSANQAIIPGLGLVKPLPHFAGGIPWANMTALADSLTRVAIHGMNFQDDALSASIGQFSRLESLDLSYNDINGSIPASITRLIRLTNLNLNMNSLSGSLPQGISSLTGLTELDLFSNSLSGPIPQELGRLRNLVILYVTKNAFSGALPESIGNLTKLESLDMSILRVTGPVPETWSSLSSLTRFQLSSCSDLVSPFPSFVTGFTGLKELKLDSNQLYGNVPSILASLTSITLLSINNNYLNGSLPAAFEDLSSSVAVYGNCFASSSPSFSSTQRSPAECSAFYENLFPVAVPAPSSSTLSPAASSSSSSIPIIVGALVGAVIFIIAVAAIILFTHHYRSGRVLRQLQKGLNQLTREFTTSELKQATKNWSTEIGRGGYGTVFKATLKDGSVVAVKRLEIVSEQGDVEFMREVELLSRIHHRHLVNLVGFCAEKGERALIYEFMAFGSIFDHLHGSKAVTLTWEDRIKIAIHVALGIEYLHFGADPPLIHRDIKSANILLSEDGYTKVADFGLCKEAPMGMNEDGEMQLVPKGTEVRGSFGYLDPEYVNTSILSEKSDVYSYGVVLLELITGHKSIHEWQPLAYWAEEYLVDREKTPLMVDPTLEGSFDPDELYALCDIAHTCVQDQAINRPTIREVAKSLVENLGHAMTSSYASSSRDTASIISSSQSDACSMPSTSLSAPSSEFSYQNYSETLHWTPDMSGKFSGSKSGGVMVSTGTNGDHLPVPVPRRQDAVPEKDNGHSFA